ncbi:MAG: hypothetical protein H6811_01610 [Phycisphaeraceae bacterium]|nr:hypothetical protein [Phycisphaeraceae bacterium]
MPVQASGGGPVPIGQQGQWSLQTRLGREYIHSPGYVDEFVCSVDRFGTPAFILQDANSNVIALTDAAGAVLTQYTWDPYGQLVDEQRATASFADNAIGHQGLFFDCLDGDADDPSLVAGVEGLYYARNRSLSTRFRRWLQADPSGTGIDLLTAAWSRGQVPQTGMGACDPKQHFGDGLNLHVAALSNPIANRDPDGLFAGLVGLFAPMSTMDVYLDYNEQALSGGLSAREVIAGQFDNAAWTQVELAELILDWSVEDAAIAGAGVGLVVQLANRHHVIPSFLLGLNKAANRLNLPQSEHKIYHRILEEKFREQKLDPPTASGDRRWIRRLTKGEVKTAEINKVRKALMDAARRFDDVTGGHFDVAKRTRIGLNARHYASGILDVGRTLRRRR